MSQDRKGVQSAIDKIQEHQSIEDYANQIRPRTQEELSHLGQNAFDNRYSKEGHKERISFLKENNIVLNHITGHEKFDDPVSLKGNIENYIGMAQVPIGLAGPLLINGTLANGDFYVPLATTEGALVASYNRGMKACRLSGGATSICLTEGIQRSPFFKFEGVFQAGLFVRWTQENFKKFGEIVGSTSNYAKLMNMKTNVEGNSVILTFEYETGDAAGQNMVTICTDNIIQYAIENFNILPSEYYIESNYSGDKKATAVSFTGVRGTKVTSEITLLRPVIEKSLKSTPEKMVKYWQSSTLAVIQSGAIGAQGHVANGLTALFIACGQDVACIAESSVGITRMEIDKNGDLYVAVTLPSLIVGTVGGGTRLPTQNESLQMLNCAGENKSRKFAEICGSLALAGEVSIAAAISSHHFTNAHKFLGRIRK